MPRKVENGKVTPVRASMVVTYYIKLFPHGDRQRQRYFNVSSPFNRRDNNYNLWIKFQRVDIYLHEPIEIDELIKLTDQLN